MRFSAIFLESGLSGSGAVGGALSRASAPTGRSTFCFLPSAVSGRGVEGPEGPRCEIPVPLMATSREAACASLSLSVVGLGPKLSESWTKSQLSSSVDSGVTRKRASARAFEGDSAASLVLAWNCCSKLTASPASAASDIGPGSEGKAAGDAFNCIKGREMDSKGRRSPLASVEKLSNFSKVLSWLLPTIRNECRGPFCQAIPVSASVLRPDWALAAAEVWADAQDNARRARRVAARSRGSAGQPLLRHEP